MKAVRNPWHARICATVLAVLAIVGTAAAEDADERAAHVNDPLEGMNKIIYHFNKDIFDKYILIPLVKFHNRAIPRPARVSIRNFLENLREPVTVGNNLLQMHPGLAADSAGRFGINSTIGILGLRDVADGMGLHRSHEDFGQTLGRYGVPQGPYLVLPVLGSSSVRDLTGHFADEFLDPFHYITFANKTYWTIGKDGATLVESRAHKTKEAMRAGRPLTRGYEQDRERYTKEAQDEAYNRPDEDDVSTGPHEAETAQLAAPSSIISAPSNQMSAVNGVRDQLSAMHLVPTSLAVSGTTLTVQLRGNASSTPLSCSDLWSKMNLDALQGIDMIDISMPMGTSQFSCTRFLNPTPPPSLPPPVQAPPSKGPPTGLPGA